ncbi:MAG TPA: DUF4097 family beta strand repeat-containing protein [Terriglobales bacterium]|jgi:DUF4097 and DUF4098 domain-containing protein YvlB|nr:DUF4097 family beta strand repeat-containing protein [Terriglobales bacterium]
MLILGALYASVSRLPAESTAEFKRVLALAPSDHIVLDVAVVKGDVTITYKHAGEIAVSAVAHANDGTDLPANFFDDFLQVERIGSHVKIQTNSGNARSSRAIRFSYTIEVPNWIEVNSSVQEGRQVVAGVMGPVRVMSDRGDIRVSYVTTSLVARTGNGSIDINHVGASAKVETGSGNIEIKDVGPASVATVKQGTGRIETDGVRGSFTGSTDAGELELTGGVFDDWDLTSGSGNIRMGIAAESKFDLDVTTASGSLFVENASIESEVEDNRRECHQKVNGGGKHVRAHSNAGNIFIQ